MSGKTARHIRSFPPEAERAAAGALLTALADRAAASALDGWVFFDRGLIDAAANLQFMTGEPALATLGQSHRYHRRVFLTPPWHGNLFDRPGAASQLGKSACGVPAPSRKQSVAGLRSLHRAKDRGVGTCRLRPLCAGRIGCHRRALGRNPSVASRSTNGRYRRSAVGG